MERRVLLAFFLSLLVLLAYQFVFVPAPPVEPPEAAAGAPAAVGGAVSAPPASPLTPAAPAGVPATAAPPGAAAPAAAAAAGVGTAPAAGLDAAVPEAEVTPLIAGEADRDIVVETPLVRAVFRNRGATLVSWRLKHHVDQVTGVPIDLIPAALPPAEPAPFTLEFDDPALTARAAEALFRASSDSITLTDRQETLTFDFEDASGFRIRKEFGLDPGADGYVLRVGIAASLAGQPLEPALHWGPGLGGVEASSSGIAYLAGPQGLIAGRILEGGALADEDVTRLDASDVAALPLYGGQFGFVGVENHYFLAAAITGHGQAEVTYRPLPLPPLQPDGASRELVAFALRLPAAALEDLPVFLGPKEFEALERAAPALVQAIDFGWLGWLVVPLHRSLTWIHGYVGNWGWAIIILTILVNIVIFPLRHKSVVSMRKMQEVQPEMKAIQERYAHMKATDPQKQKMNQEIMALYRDRGVNPASGCLPMLLTFPVLFAFFSLLRAAVEIRGQPFIGWITDLTLHDPFYITPIVMGASMVLQQKMTPTQADPMQQKIMMLMPVIFTFMFLRMPSGLVIYWLTSNVFGIVQQVVTNRIIGPPVVRKVRPPAERRIRKDGDGTKGGGGAKASGPRTKGGGDGAKASGPRTKRGDGTKASGPRTKRGDGAKASGPRTKRGGGAKASGPRAK